MCFPACSVDISDERTASAVCAALRLEGIGVSGGEILVTDRPLSGIASDDPQIRGIVLLSRMHPEPEIGIPMRHLHIPFAYAELIEAVRALSASAAVDIPEVREAREEPAEERSGIQISGMKLTCGGKSAELTAKEMRLFLYLRSHAGKIVTRQELLRDVWETDDDSTNITDVYISYLRRKLTPIFGRGVLLSVRGKGYILQLPE